jgi:hypothetical protein
LDRKRFIERSLFRLYRNLGTLNACIKSYFDYEPSAVYEDLPKAIFDFGAADQNGIPDFRVNYQNVDAEAWMKAVVVKDPLWPEHLIHITPRGEKVRSKSEAIIASLLYTNNIPYKYEDELLIGDRSYYPDFTIRRPKDGKIFYWEHFGMIEDHNYLEAMENKLAVYRQNNISPWYNLLMTYDVDGSIDAQMIQSLISSFLL